MAFFYIHTKHTTTYLHICSHVGKYSCLSSLAGTDSMHLYVDDSYHPSSLPYKTGKKCRCNNQAEEKLCRCFAIEGKPALIPCRPAHPQFNVILERKTPNLLNITDITCYNQSGHNMTLFGFGDCKNNFSNKFTWEDIKKVQEDTNITSCDYKYSDKYTELPWNNPYLYHPRLGYIFEK